MSAHLRVLPECDYECRGCSLTTCRDTDPSPGEDDHLCADCAPFEETA